MDCMSGMGWMHGGMAVLGIVWLAVMLLGAAALVKYLRKA